ncbi:hypothetical protein BN85406390 [Alteracholeplasma palmae J233]|uniref:Uncharacterized protein n=1 Tax=Alteracholeplasma palmae (strain ATCC 49389 / J233) TaxID=1318466 RepID=U4KRJ3_ALTPJ|nr:hypothetical protein [Alteracholeplasma palmae]CCV64216.1 hypothetical protein BN85406390 [Alteracholeplasma palmae J233]
MRKHQQYMQKISIILFLIFIVSLIFYSWAFMTDYNSMALVINNKEIYTELQNVNNKLFSYGFMMIIIFALTVILGSYYRRKYYISNYISIIVFIVIAIIFISLNYINLTEASKNINQAIENYNDFLSTVPEQMKQIYGRPYTDKIILYGIVINTGLIVSIIGIGINLVWQFKLREVKAYDK